MAEIIRKIITPSVPNYVRLETAAGERQDGFCEGEIISIGDLSDVTLEAISNDWRIKLLEKAEIQRASKKAKR